jgi:hypothetical protein
MRENRTVFPHRACGFAAGDPALNGPIRMAPTLDLAGAPIPGMGFIELVSPGHASVFVGRDKVAAGEAPAAPAMLEQFR